MRVRHLVLLTLTDSEGEVLVEWGLAHGPDEIRSFTKDLTYQGKRTGTIMPQLAKGFSDQQIASLAAYFAASKP